jgi:serine protease AprX
VRATRRPQRMRHAVAGLALALSAAPLCAGVIERELLEILRTAPPEQEIPVLVAFAGPADLPPARSVANQRAARRAELVTALRQQAADAQQPARELLRGRTLEEPISLWAINGMAVSARPPVIRELAALTGVSSVRLDATVKLQASAAGAAPVPGWNLAAVRAPGLWASGYRGAGVVVAVVDSGVDVAHRDLAGRFRGGDNSWFDPSGKHATPYDRDGHGTQAAGLIVGESTLGVAPHAMWIAAKIFDDDGTAKLSAIHQGFQWLLDPDNDPATDDAPDVVNNSWGFPEKVNECFREFEPDIAVLKAAGLAVVFAAGNDGPASSSSVSPANNAGGFAVGAVDESGIVEISSSRGPSACGGIFPHVAAPGVDVQTTDLTFGGVVPGSLATVTGSSFAAPHAAGVMALLRGAYPQATPDQLEEALLAGAHDLGEPGADNEYGHGLIDATAALAALDGVLGAPACRDGDGDGYYPTNGCGTALDCNDGDPTIHPGAAEQPGDGVDQDCDGAGGSRPRVRRRLGRASYGNAAPAAARGER